MLIKDLIDILMAAFAVGLGLDMVIAWMANYRYLLRDPAGNAVGPVFSVVQLHGKKNTVGFSIFSMLDGILTLSAATLIGAVTLGLYYHATKEVDIDKEYIVFFLWFGLMRIKRSLSAMHVARQFRNKDNPTIFRDGGNTNYAMQVNSLPWVIREVWLGNTFLLITAFLFCSLFY